MVGLCQENGPVILTFHESVEMRRPAEVVFAYVSDFNKAHEWRVEVRASSQAPDGPMTDGSRLREESAILGVRVVTESVVDAFEAGHRFHFNHVAGPIPVDGEYLVESDGNDARLTYTLRADLRGVWALAAPILKRSGRRMIIKSLDNLKARLERDPRP